MEQRDRGWPRAVRAAVLVAVALPCALSGSSGWAQTTGIAGTPFVSAGEGATPPTESITEREQLVIVGSSTVQAYALAAIEALQRDYVLPQPVVDVQGTTEGMKRFCAGIGPKYPDIAAASRVMQKGEFDTCLENGILDIVEIKIGQMAFVVLTKKGDPVFNITPRMMYLALAMEIPEEGDFQSNPFATWKQIESTAPDLPINVIVPTTESGLRTFFDLIE